MGNTARAIVLDAKVTPSGRLTLRLPSGFPSGTVRVVVLGEAAAGTEGLRLARKKRSQPDHPGFGLWADMDDWPDAVALAQHLRDRVEKRTDRLA